MPQVFVDTVAWIALINVDDTWHGAALGTLSELQRRGARLVTTEFVLLEVADALSSPGVRSRTVAFLEGLRGLPALEIIAGDGTLFEEGWRIYRQRGDKGWSLTDSTSFAKMSQLSIDEAFTANRHFEQAGFTRMLS